MAIILPRGTMSIRQKAKREAEQKYREYEQGHQDIDAVPLQGEGDHGESHTRHGYGDQQQETELDQVAAVPGNRAPRDPGHIPQVRRFPAKNPGIGNRGPVSDQVDDASREDHCGSHEDTPP